MFYGRKYDQIKRFDISIDFEPLPHDIRSISDFNSVQASIT